MDIMSTRMSSIFTYATTIAFIIVAATVVLLSIFLTTKRDPREPPMLQPAIPVIGHLINMIREGGDYYTRLDRKHHRPIYTLPILGGKMYFINSPDWAQVMHKATKTLSFNTLVGQAMKKVFCMDEPTMAIINNNLNGEQGNRSGVMLETHDMIMKTLGPGKDMDELNRNFLKQLLPYFNSLAKDDKSKNLMLWQWVRRNFTLVSMAAIWGPDNPFATDPSLETDFWQLEDGTMRLMLAPLPSITCRKSYKARQRCFDAMIDYAEKDGASTGSQFAKNRAEINLRHGLTRQMYGMGEVSMIFGALVNTGPASFWLTSYIFADPRLLAEVRAEIDRCVRIDGGNKRIVNATKIKKQCPLFNSAFRETLRIAGLMNLNRYVLEDTTLTNNVTGESYLVKKDNIVGLNSNVIHYQSEIWGEDCHQFNARRFLPTVNRSRNDAEMDKPIDPASAFRDSNGKIHSGAFRSFGGGNNICPGRFFAQTEVMALASLFVAGFEIENAGGGNVYRPPPFEDARMLMGMVKPKHDVKVNLRRRIGYEDIEWDFEV